MKYLFLWESFKEDTKLVGCRIIIDQDRQVVVITDDDYGVLSMIGMGVLDESINYVGGVASKEGLGLGYYVYLYAMMSIYPKTLMPSRDGGVRGGAWNIWCRLYEDDQVHKKTLPMGNENYLISIITGEVEKLDKQSILNFIEMENISREEWAGNDVKYDLSVFNSEYSIEPSKYFLDNRVFLKSLPDDIQLKVRDGYDELFEIRYNES